jgi:hypothetical protein
MPPNTHLTRAYLLSPGRWRRERTARDLSLNPDHGNAVFACRGEADETGLVPQFVFLPKRYTLY